jgi:mevalonate kinase
LKLRIPSKTFLWGEYSALIGGSAGVLTGPPYFEFSLENDLENNFESNFKFKTLDKSINKTNLFHPESLAGKLLNKYNKKEKDLSLKFIDPYNLKGGFGRSTAEYISAMAMAEIDCFDPLSISQAWQEYRTLQGHKKNQPSGYDFIAQAVNTLDADTAELGFKITNIKVKDHNPAWTVSSDFLKKIGIMVFKTAKKVKTHEHINDIELERLAPLNSLSQKVSECFQALVVKSFFESLECFDLELKRLNLVHPESEITCAKIKKISHVTYARGCGALNADVIIVFYAADLNLEQRFILRQSILESSELIFIADTKGID